MLNADTAKDDSQYSTSNLRLEEEPNDHPRHLTIHSNHILAIGGEDGIISATPINNTKPDTTRIIQTYDEPVKALAFSDDGQRVAVGYEDGFVDIYVYSSEDIQDAKDNAEGYSHPFISSKKTKSKNDDDDDDDDNEFFSQSSQFENEADLMSSTAKPTFRLSHRFEASIRHLQFRPQQQGSKSTNKYYLAIAAESNPGFMIVDVTSEDSFAKYLNDESSSVYNQGGVRSLHYSPDGNMILTLGMDGRMCFWSTGGDDPELDWELKCRDDCKVVEKADMGEFADAADKSLYPVWSKCGKVVGIPGSADLKLRKAEDGSDDDDDWIKNGRLILNMDAKNSGESECTVGLAFDPTNEGYVVTSTRDGKVCLWQIDNNRKDDEPEGRFVKEILSHESLPTHIIWHKNEDTKRETLFLALENGSMITIEGRNSFIPKEKIIEEKKAVEDKSTDLEIEKEQEDLFDVSDLGLVTQPPEDKTHQKGRLKRKKSEYDDDDDDDDDDVVLDDMESSSNAKQQRNQFVADEAEENVLNDDESQFDDVIQSTKDSEVTTTTTAPNLPEVVDNDDNDDLIDNNEFGGDDYGDDDMHQESINKTQIAIPLQPAFAPSSTPPASRRILCWNHMGVVTSRWDDEVKSIDINFTDALANRPISFRNNMDFVLGSFGEEGAIFSTDLVDDNEDDLDDDVRNTLDKLGMSDATKAVVKRSERRRDGNRRDLATGSCIYFHRFQTFGPQKNKDWTVTLPEGEKVVGCATGEGWNAVITNRRFLRTFSSAGVQGPVVWLKGEPVTIVGRGRFLAVFFHESNPLVDGTQKLGFSLYDGITLRQIACNSVDGISPCSSLIWAGFSDDLALSIMDSDGMVSMLFAKKPSDTGDSTSMTWIPILDTIGMRKSREDSFWPVAVQSGKFVCVPLKGVTSPNPARRPLTTSLALRMPLARTGTSKNFGLEEVSARANLALDHKNFLNDFNVNNGTEDADAVDMKFNDICAQVDKLNLQLFIHMAQASKLEAALDLVNRFHLEKSFELAMNAADKLNYRKLSDRIYDIMGEKYRSNQDDHDLEGPTIDAESFYDGDSCNGSVATLEHSRDIEKRNVSPETANIGKKMIHSKETTMKPKSRKRINPFATDTKISPGKKSQALNSPVPKKPALSRMSTFSAESRRRVKRGKDIL